MFASALVPAYAIAVLAPAGPDDGCPSPRQLTDALETHLPGIVAPLGQPIAPTTLRLAVTTDPNGETRLDLSDGGGESLLRRQLPVSSRGRGGDCPALAESVALIVDRYWREIGSDVRPVRPANPPPEATPRQDTPATRAPPSETPPAAPDLPPAASVPLTTPGSSLDPVATEGRAASPPSSSSSPTQLSLGAAIVGRVGETADPDAAAMLAFTLETAAGRRRFGLRLSGGVTSSATVGWDAATASFRRFPLRLGAFVPVRLAVGQLEPGVDLVLDLISVRLTDAAGGQTRLGDASLCSGQLCASPGGGVSLAWAVVLAQHVYFRALGRMAASIPYSFAAPMEGTVWSTPRTYLELGLEWGFWF